MIVSAPSRPRQSLNVAARAGGWSARHPWKALGGWLLFVALACLIGFPMGKSELSQSQGGSGEAAVAQGMWSKYFGEHAGEMVLLHSDLYTVDDSQFVNAINDVSDRVASSAGTTGVQSPLASQFSGQISADRHSALVIFQIAGSDKQTLKLVTPILSSVQSAAALHPGIAISETGDASIGHAINDVVLADLHRAELLSFPITLGVLIVAFGALLAAVVPVALSISAILASSALLAFTSRIWPVSVQSTSSMVLIGLAVGVDYSLFYIKRAREERALGNQRRSAIEIAAATSGKSVLVSGLAVLVAMSGMFLAGNRVFVGMGQAAMLVVLVAVVGSLTALPAILSLLDNRIEWGRVPFIKQNRASDGSKGMWASILNLVLPHPVASFVGAMAVLIVLAVPALQIHTANSGVADLPRSPEAINTYYQTQQYFPGGASPALVMLKVPDTTNAEVSQAIINFEARATASQEMFQPIQVRASAGNQVVAISVPLAGSGEDAKSVHALKTLRKEVIPTTIGALPGSKVAVGGETAGSTDFNAIMHERIPMIFGFVLLLAFVVLFAAFRSLVIAATAIALNLLSVAASYGVLVALFQWGWGESILGFTSYHAVESWLPLFLFVILFGLSMDYHVFILSRIREAHDKGMSTADAIDSSIIKTAGVVTAAAVVMVFVFLTFATLSMTSMKALGVGLSVAVLLDATIVRAVLLPATMKLLGDANWYRPRAGR